MSTKMPTVDRTKLAGLTPDELALVNMVIKKDDTVRASKPTLPKKVEVPDDSPFKYHYDYANPEDAKVGKAAFIWRWVVLMVSPIRQHQCMPVMAFCDLPRTATFDEQRAMEKELQAIADKVVDAIDPRQWHGVKRWGKVLA